MRADETRATEPPYYSFDSPCPTTAREHHMPRLRSISLLFAASLAATACIDATAPSVDVASYDLLFESMASPQENQAQLFRLREGETIQIPVLGGNNFAAQPRVSADGRWVAYMAPRPGGAENAVWLARTDGTGQRLLFTTDER